MKRISRWLACLSISAFLFISLVSVAHATPVMPHTFYGTLKINGDNTPIGTIVKAKVGGMERGSFTTTEAGKYGNAAEAVHLVVQGLIDEGATINFYVNSVDTNQTELFIPGGGPTELNLTATISTEDGGNRVGGGGGTAVTRPTTVEASLFGATVEFSIDSKGMIQEAIEAISEDRNLTIIIPKGTTALGKDGNPLDSLETVVDESPPDAPEDAHVIGLAYDFGPAGATFNPPITLTWSYDPAEIPEGVAEEDLVLYYYDDGSSKWVELECVVDTENNSITASVEHFTTFAVLGYEVEVPPLPTPTPTPAAFNLRSLSISPVEANIGETVTISILIANTGGTEGTHAVTLKINRVKEGEKSVTIAADSSQKVTFAVSRDVAGSYSVDVNGLTDSFTIKKAPVAPAPPPPAPPSAASPIPPVEAINWSVPGGVIAAVIVVGLFIFFLARRRAY